MGVTALSLMPEDKRKLASDETDPRDTQQRVHAKELIQTADWLSVFMELGPTGLQKTVNNHRDRLSSFISLFCFCP